MIEKQISAKTTGDNPQEFTQTFDWPENLNEAVEMWGEDDCFSLLGNAKVVRIQANMRRPSTRKTVPTFEVYKQLIAAGMEEDKARKISQYAGNADGSNSEE